MTPSTSEACIVHCLPEAAWKPGEVRSPSLRHHRVLECASAVPIKSAGLSLDHVFPAPVRRCTYQ